MNRSGRINIVWGSRKPKDHYHPFGWSLVRYQTNIIIVPDGQINLNPLFFCIIYGTGRGNLYTTDKGHGWGPLVREYSAECKG